MADPRPRSEVSDLSLQLPAQIVGYRGHGRTGPQNEEGSMRRCVVKQLPVAFGSAHNWKFSRPSRIPSGLQKACIHDQTTQSHRMAHEVKCEGRTRQH